MADQLPVPAPGERHPVQHQGRVPFPVWRTVLVFLATVAGICLSALIFKGVSLTDGVLSAAAAAVVIALLNALVWPLVIRFALPFTVLTMGLGVLVLNGAIVLAAGSVDHGLVVNGLLSAIGTAIVITLVTTLVIAVFSVDDDGPWERNVVARRARKVGGVEPTDVPGIFFLEIDGLAHAVVQRAIRDGNMPNVARWLREGTHHLAVWETDWSSQTGACQAGLLHGNNWDMPAFRWWEKDGQRAIVTNHPKDAAEIERRVSNGAGLLHEDGASRANILSGDAEHSMLTMSTVLNPRRGKLGQDYYGYFARPYAAVRTFVMSLGEIAIERRYALEQVRRDVQPRIPRSFMYSVARAWATVVQLDLQVAAVVSDLYAGRPVAYTTFLAYDEVAHHSGVERPDTLAVLRKVDRQLGRIVRAAAAAPRPYHFVVLADHGQSQGATFLQRYGESLEDFVNRLCTEGSSTLALTDDADTSSDFLAAQLTEVAERDSATGRAVRRVTRSRTEDGAVELGEHRRRRHLLARRGGKEQEAIAAPPPEVVVMASGNLGHITFPREPGRVTLERLRELHPGLIEGLRDHDGIGFLLVRSAERGAVVLGACGTHWLDEGVVEGEDPLKPYGPNAAHHVQRTDAFSTCPDIVVNSTYWKETDEVAAFEELVGSHGGLGGEQSFPFLVAPAHLPLPDEPLVGAEHVHAVFRGWLAQLGHEAYAGDRPRSAPVEAPAGADD